MTATLILEMVVRESATIINAEITVRRPKVNQISYPTGNIEYGRLFYI